MIRKQTWILLAVFAALLGGAYYLTKNPLPKSDSSATPSATEPAKVLSGWQPGDVTAIAVKEGTGDAYKIAQDSSGNWLLDGKDKLDSSKVEEVSASLLGLKAQTALDPGYSLDVLGLSSPSKALTLTNKQNKTVELRIGNLTPTESGYYTQLDNAAPVVVSKGGIDDLLQLVSRASLLNWTPTPSPSPSATPGAGTPQPQATATVKP